MSSINVKAYYYIDKRRTSVSCSTQPFASEDDADNAAWLCANMPGCRGAEVVRVGLVTPKRYEETVVRVYARCGENGIVEDVTETLESLRQLRAASADGRVF